MQEMAADVNAMAKCCDAVVVVTAFLAGQHEGEDVWLRNAKELLSLTPGVPLGTYECPVPYKRLLSADAMHFLAGSGRFHFHKDTCCNIPEMTAKLAAIKEAQSASGGSFAFFNANVETLLPSLDEGAAGFSGISANFYPHLHAWLCAAAAGAGGGAKRKRAREDMERVQDFLSLAEATVCVSYPHSAKAYLGLNYAGLALNAGCRKPELVNAELPPHAREALRAMWRMQRALSKTVGAVEIDPATGKKAA